MIVCLNWERTEVMITQKINPRDMYYFSRKTGKSVEFLTTHYFEEVVSEDRIPRYVTRKGLVVQKAITDPVFEDRWENDQILLAAFLQGWEEDGVNLIRKNLYFGYDLSVPFWKQYNERMSELIRLLRKHSTFMEEE